MNQHTEGKWLIHGTKRQKGNQLQSPEPPVKQPSTEFKHDISYFFFQTHLHASLVALIFICVINRAVEKNTNLMIG